MNLRICFAIVALLFCVHPLDAQKIIITPFPAKLVLTDTLDENKGFFYFDLDISVKNNTRDSIKIPPRKTELEQVWMKSCEYRNWQKIDFTSTQLPEMDEPRKRVLAPDSTAIITVQIWRPTCLKKGKNIVKFHPVITDMKGKDIKLSPVNVVMINHLTSNGQGISVTGRSKMTITDSTPEREGMITFPYEITIRNNTPNSVIIPAERSSLDEVNMSSCAGTKAQYIESVATQHIVFPRQRILASGQIAKTTVTAFRPTCRNKRKAVVKFYPIITDMSGKQLDLEPVRLTIYRK